MIRPNHNENPHTHASRGERTHRTNYELRYAMPKARAVHSVHGARLFSLTSYPCPITARDIRIIALTCASVYADTSGEAGSLCIHYSVASVGLAHRSARPEETAERRRAQIRMGMSEPRRMCAARPSDILRRARVTPAFFAWRLSIATWICRRRRRLIWPCRRSWAAQRRMARCRPFWAARAMARRHPQ